MAQHCHFCGKIPMTGHRVSHAHNVTNRKWHLNLKTVRAVVGGVDARTSGLHALHPVGQGRQARRVEAATAVQAASAARQPAGPKSVDGA